MEQPEHVFLDPGKLYSAILLLQASLYVFAEMYDVKNLRREALKGLQSSLGALTLDREHMLDVVKPIEHVSSHNVGLIDPTQIMIGCHRLAAVLPGQRQSLPGLAKNEENLVAGFRRDGGGRLSS
jgi:hypothetical protein